MSKATREQYKAAEVEYCKEYTEAFSKLIGIPLKFNDMTSPREYNFMTDRIFAEISEADVEKLKEIVDPIAIRLYVRNHFTSYDGFSSFYDNDYDRWLKQDEPFDHNQIGALLDCYAPQVDEEWNLTLYYDMN